MAINRELPGLTGRAQEAAAQAADRAAPRADPLDIALVEHYLACTRRGDDRVSVDTLHLAQLCNEVWRRRRKAAEANPILQGLREKDREERGLSTERGNSLALKATEAIANVGHDSQFQGRPMEATAIVMVANLLAEALNRRKATDHSVMLVGGVVHGSQGAIEYVRGAIAELMEWRSEAPNLVVRELVREPGHLGAGVLTVRGSAEAIGHLNKMLDELESSRRVITELERMGWLMKAPGK